MTRILILGGSGFVGRHLCAKASQLGARITLATRRLELAKPVRTLPWVNPIEVDIHDQAALTRLVRGHDAVVNLVAILHGDAAAFAQVHVDLVQKLVHACEASGVRRLVHVSALGAAPDAPSMYQRSKSRGEAVLAASNLDVTLLRPSVVFGDGDQFLNLFAKMQALLPLVPLAGAETRFQPVWVEDLALAIVRTLARGSGVANNGAGARASIFEACGPDVFSLRQLVRLAGQMSGHPRPVIALPAALARLQARVMEHAPGPVVLSRDNLDSMRVDNVASGVLPGLAQLGIRPSSLLAVGPTYLGRADEIEQARQRATRWFE